MGTVNLSGQTDSTFAAFQRHRADETRLSDQKPCGSILERSLDLRCKHRRIKNTKDDNKDPGYPHLLQVAFIYSIQASHQVFGDLVIKMSNVLTRPWKQLLLVFPSIVKAITTCSQDKICCSIIQVFIALPNLGAFPCLGKAVFLFSGH